jgi:hypothetical protein
MKFKDFVDLTENGQRTGAKLGLYPNLMDAIGQYPPLYGIPSAADLITYIDIQFGPAGPPGKNGIIRYGKERIQHPHPQKAAN